MIERYLHRRWWSSIVGVVWDTMVDDGWWSFPLLDSWLVVLTILKNMRKSVGMMTFPVYGKIKHVPNHQPDSHSWVFWTFCRNTHYKWVERKQPVISETRHWRWDLWHSKDLVCSTNERFNKLRIYSKWPNGTGKMICDLPSAMGNGPFIDGLPIKNCDFPWLC